MIRFAFRKGLTFLDGAIRWQLLRVTPFGKFQFENERGELENLSQPEVHARWQTGAWRLDEHLLGDLSDVTFNVTPRDLSTFSDAEKLGAKRRQMYVHAAMSTMSQSGKGLFCGGQIDTVIKEVADKIQDAAPPHASTVRLWLTKYARTKCVTKLVDGRSRSGRKQEQVARSLFEETVKEVFLTSQKRPRLQVYQELKKKVLRLNASTQAEETRMPPPSRATVYRWLEKLNYDVELLKREGPKASALALSAALGEVKVNSVLERIEIDHTPVNLLVIDKVRGLVLGRPWLTLAVDCYSRVILGFYLSFHAPSAYSVLHCLKMAIMPKGVFLKQFETIKHEWECFGIPDLIVSDNGMDLHAGAVEDVTSDLGVQHIFCPTGKPQMKARIERLMRTIAEDLFHELPGTTFSNPDQRGDYPAEKLAALDINDLTEIITKWIVDIYNQTPHRGLKGHTPYKVWLEGTKKRTIELPAYPEQLDNIVGEGATRSIFHYGVEIDNLRYNSPELQRIKHRQEETQRVAIKFYEEKVDFINVLDPDTEEYISVPAVNMEYATGLTRYVHRLVMQAIRKRLGDDWHEIHLLEMRAEMEELIEAAVSSKKQADRKRAAAAKLRDSNSANKPVASKPNVPKQTSPQPKKLDPGLDDELPVFGARFEKELSE
jgi:putative transposase